jgi:hypothetical protein
VTSINVQSEICPAALFDMMINLLWGLFPNYGSYCDPFVMVVILVLMEGSVVALWGPSTLARFRYAQTWGDPLKLLNLELEVEAWARLSRH